MDYVLVAKVTCIFCQGPEYTGDSRRREGEIV